MKRSEINRVIEDAKDFFAEHKFYLPVWAYWGLNDWKANLDDASEVLSNKLGWDITDFGSGDFKKCGLFLFTVRNGIAGSPQKPYAEKIMIVEEEQETPMHHHWSKVEDIINRGGGNLIIQLFNSNEKDLTADTDVKIKIDHVLHTVKAGDSIRLLPGQSVCLEQHHYHRFYGEKGKGRILVGEVSSVNNDETDNCFLKPAGRFPSIEEDETPIYLLVSDYGKLF